MPPPKGKEKPKTKKELKAEAEAAARAAEEERQRQEEEARRVAAQAEQRRQELLAEYASRRDAKLSAERQQLVPLLQQLQQRRAEMAAIRADAADWEQYLACSPLPDPRDRPAMNDFLNTVLAEPGGTKDLQETLQRCEACLQLAQLCVRFAAEEEMTASLQEALTTYAAGPPGAGSAAGSSCDISSTAEPAAVPAEPEGSSDAGISAAEPQAADDASTEAQQEPGADTEEAVASRPASAAPAAGPAPAAPAAWDAAAHAAESAACRARAAQHQQDASALYDSIRALVDATTAHVLLRADEYADPKGDVLLTAQQGPLQWGLWVNKQKNPRFKLLDLAGLGMTLEIPKQLALANIAIRVQRHPFDTCSSSNSSSSSCEDGQPSAAGTSCLAPLGGVLHVELLTLPPPPKHGKGWSIRQVSPQSSSISPVPYPIPPVGADLDTWRPEEEPLPVHFSFKLPDGLLVPAAVRVGWWDASRKTWSEEGISNTTYDDAAGRLSFSSVHLGCLALLQDTSAHLPYSSWTIRPTGGMGGSTAVIDLQVPSLPSAESGGAQTTGTVSVEVGSGWAKLCGPALPQLGHLLNKALPPWELLSACAACGLNLASSSKEQQALGLLGKQTATEQAMCADLATMCSKFLVASSRWNRDAGQDVLLARLSEVHDWEEGGRTSSQAAARIFSKEAAEGDCRVLVARREGALGVSWAPAQLGGGGDNQAGPPPVQDLSTVEAVLAALEGGGSPLAASLLHLSQPEQTLQAADAVTTVVDAGLQGSMLQVLCALRLCTFG